MGSRSLRRQKELCFWLLGQQKQVKHPLSGFCRSAGAGRNPSLQISSQTVSRPKLLIQYDLLHHRMPGNLNVRNMLKLFEDHTITAYKIKLTMNFISQNHDQQVSKQNIIQRKYTLVFGAFTANSAAATLGDRQPSSLFTDEPPPLPRSSEPATGGVRDLPPLEVLENALSSASARNTVCAAVNTDVGDPSCCSRRDCIRGAGGFTSCLSAGACFLAAPSTLRGYGWAGFLLGRGGGIWIAGAASERLLFPDDSLTTCRTEHRGHQSGGVPSEARRRLLYYHDRSGWVAYFGSQSSNTAPCFLFSWQRSESLGEKCVRLRPW
jgi:hypothetical protein